MNNMSPLLSIIIATRNCADDLKKNLDSISQTIWDVTEIIIQDGNSSDHTLSVAASYPQLNLHVESSPDTGVYDAWNKAVQRASGEWILFMGAGDFLCVSTSVQSVFGNFSFYSYKKACGQ
ncbi:glycosyltransferase, partial [Desulfovibrio piger]|uniref:glycosyltransferase n=1 Tax=Desulfovibrio piger TaxID=901 RepID=UPI0026F118C0